MSLNRFHIVSPIALMAFSACRSPYVQGGSVGGAVVNGPLDSALVFLDYDFDGVLDAGEPNARTNSFGEYQLTSTRDLYDLVAIADDQTVDSSSGATFAGLTLKAPSGAGVISPTSTLMKEGDLTAAEVAEVLGLPDGVDPLSFNPFNVDENDATEVARALEVAKISKQITTAISSFASATEGAGADAADAFNTALNSVVDVVKTKAVNAKDANAAAADKIIDFTGTDDLDLIKSQVTTKAADLKGLDRATFNNLAADTTAAIRNVNTEIKAVTDLNSDATKNIFSTTQVLRDQIKDVAVARKAGQAGDITFKSADAVRTSMNNKAPEAITLSGSKFIHGDAESLVIGEVGTIDSDTGDTTFTYTLAGRDADMFSFNATTGELSLKAQPDHAKKPYYEITIISKDPGGKKFAETFIIDVVPEFGALGAPDPQILADFDMIMKENPIFMKMAGQIHLKTTPDGKLVMEEMASPGPGSGPATGPGPKPGEIVGIINITDRGYELRNPANEEYMGGFFKYETKGLTYTGFEVFIEDENELGRFEKHLKKYFAPNSEYGAKKLGYTERDVDFVSLVGAKVVDKAGKVVSDMLGFSHYDENMKILGSTGIDKADPNYPYYVEVKGEFVPGVNSNITATAVDAGTATIMKDLIMIASDAILYAEDPGTAVGDPVSETEVPVRQPETPPVGQPETPPVRQPETPVSETETDIQKLLESVSVFAEIGNAITFNSSESGLTLVDVGDGDIFSINKSTSKQPLGMEVFEVSSMRSMTNHELGRPIEGELGPIKGPIEGELGPIKGPSTSAHIEVKTKGDLLTSSNVYTDQVDLGVVYYSRSKEAAIMREIFNPPQVKIREVQLRESYSKGDDVFLDHHWLMVEFLDSESNIVGTTGISVKEGESYKFLGNETFSADTKLENTTPLSKQEVDQAQQAFFDIIEDIILENNTIAPGLIKLPTDGLGIREPEILIPEISRPELIVELPERTPELRIPELVERIPVEAFAVEDPVALELNLLEPSEII